jgi:hypothetical protein
MAQEEARLYNELYIIKLEIWTNIFRGIKDASESLFSFFLGNPLGATSGILQQLSTLSDISGGPEQLTKGLEISSDIIGITGIFYGSYKDIKNISKLGGIVNKGQLTFGKELYRIKRLRFIYRGYKLGNFLGKLFK